MLKWFKSLFSRNSLSLNDDERQNLTTYSMMIGSAGDLVAIALILWVLRFSWPEAVAIANAPLLMGYFFQIALALIGLQLVRTVVQGAIAIGGKLKAAFAGASVEAECDK